MRSFLLILALSLNSFAASPLIFGARGGVPLNNSLTGSNSLGSSLGLNSPTQSYVVGPTAGLRLPLGFSVEGDALFTRQSLDFGNFGGFTPGAHADSWEFPVMLKFTAGHHAIAPVLGAGVTVRHINNFGDVPTYLLTGSTTSNTVGFVAGAGLQFTAGPVHITPEIRYTRWSNQNLVQSLEGVITGTNNQAQVLLGLTF